MPPLYTSLKMKYTLLPHFLPDHAEFEAVVTAALDDRRIAHLHSRGINTTQKFPVLDRLFDRLCQPTVFYFLLNMQTSFILMDIQCKTKCGCRKQKVFLTSSASTISMTLSLKNFVKTSLVMEAAFFISVCSPSSFTAMVYATTALMST